MKLWVIILRWHSSDYVDCANITCENCLSRYQFVPQMIFLNSLFGYLSLLIIVKWCSGSKADLYHILIYMFLSPTDDLGENQLFFGQKLLQVLLLSFFHYCSSRRVLDMTSDILCLVLADYVALFGPYLCTMDAISETFYSEEAIWRSMPNLHLVNDLFSAFFLSILFAL